MVSRTLSVAKRFLRRYQGRLPARNLYLTARRAHQTRSLEAFEQREIGLAVGSWSKRPVASVAVVIPTRGRPDLVQRAVSSVLSQSVEDLIVVVVEDPDGTAAASSLAGLPPDDRVWTYRLSRPCGVAGVVRNVGIAASHSRFVAFLDDDNRWLPDHLQRSLAAHRGGACFSYTALQRVDSLGRTIDTWSKPFDRAQLRDLSLADTSTIVVQREPDVRFSRLPRHRGEFPLEDWELLYRLSRTMSVVHVPVVTVEYLVHDGSYFTDWAASLGPNASGPSRQAPAEPRRKLTSR